MTFKMMAYFVHIARLKFFRFSILGDTQACVSLWLVTLAEENTFNSNRQHVASLSLSQ